MPNSPGGATTDETQDGQKPGGASGSPELYEEPILSEPDLTSDTDTTEETATEPTEPTKK